MLRANAEKDKQVSLNHDALNRLQKIASRVPGVVYQFLLRPDGSSCFPFASEAIREIYRVSPDEVREDASKVFANVHPDDYADLVNSIQASAQNLSAWNHEYRVKFDDGTIRSLSGNALPELEDDGSVLWHGFITDITERKLLEDALNNERALFRTIIDLIPDAVYVKDSEGRKILANPKEVHFAGKDSEDEIIGKTDSELYPDDQADSAFREDQFVFRTGNPLLDIDGKLTDRDGKFHWILASKTPLRDAHGKIIGIVGITHDNTYQKNSEHENTRQLGLINSLLDSIPDIIFFKDTEGVYLGCNPPFAAFAGKSKSEIIGQTDYDLFGKEIADVFRQYDLEMLNQKLPRHNEEWITYPDGRKMLIDTLKTPYWAGDGSLIGILGISRDITERKAAEERMSKLNSCMLGFGGDMKSNINSLVALCGETLGGVCALYNKLESGMLCSLGKWQTPDDYISIDNPHGHICYDVISMGDNEPLVIHNLQNTDYLKSDPNVSAYGLQTYIGIAVKCRQQPVGSLCVVYQNDVDLSKEYLDFLVHIGFAIAIEEEREQVKESLKQSSEKWEAIISASPDGIGMVSLDGKLQFMSDKLARMYGYPVEQKAEFFGKPFFDFIDKSSHNMLLDNLRKLLAGEDDQTIEEYLAIKKDNSRFYVDVNSTVLLDSKGNQASILFIERDITERKKVEKALRESETNFHTFFETVDDMIFVGDTQGDIFYTNNAVSRKLGYSSQELKCMHILDMHPPAKRAEATRIFGDMFAGTLDSCTLPLASKDGLLIPVETRVWYGKWNGEACVFGISKDLSKEQEAKDKYNKIFNNSPALMLLVTVLERRISEANDTFLHKTGYARDEIIGKVITDVELLTFTGQHNEIALKLKETQRVTGLELELKTKQGDLIYGVLSREIIESYGKLYFLIVITDISQIKQAEGELAESRERYRGLSEASFEAIFFSEKGLCIEQNKAAEKMFGYTTQEAIVKYGTEWIVPEHREMVMKKMLSGDENPYESVALKKDGTTFPCVLRGTMMHYKGRNVRVTSLTDITHRKQAEKELKQVYTRLTLAARAGGVGVWDFDIVNNFLVWDDQMFALYGVDKNNFSGAYEAWLAGVHPDDKERGDAEIGMAIRGEKEFDTEFRVCWPDGSIRNIRALAAVQLDDSGNPQRMIGTNWDITEHKRTEAKLIKALEEAESANMAKSVFLASMSHEIRTPLNSIIGFSQLLNRDQQLSGIQKEYNAIIIRAGEHLLSLINDILELSKMEAGRLELNPTNVDLNVFFTDIGMMFAEPARAKHLQFVLETADDIPRYILVDESKLRRLFINLIGNALKFTDEGGIVVRASFEKINYDKGNLIVKIQDSGIGIPESDLSKLFKRFQQTSAGINKSSGTGLGLALSRELAILMGGNITVTSIVGQGSVFTFNVEITLGKIEPNIDRNTKRVNSIDTGQEAFRILVVDDNEINLKVTVKLLKLLGFETMEAVNGMDAIDKFEVWDPHLILMDMQMPVMDGYEATRLIKLTEKGKQTPIIALTASLFEEDRKKILTFDLDGCILKPFRENELLGAIGNLLGIKYIYEESKIPFVEEQYLDNTEAVVEAVAKLPSALLVQMKNAVASANVDLLIKLIDKIEPEHSGLSSHLMTLANNYDYDYLQKILTQKEQTP